MFLVTVLEHSFLSSCLTVFVPSFVCFLLLFVPRSACASSPCSLVQCLHMHGLNGEVTIGASVLVFCCFLLGAGGGVSFSPTTTGGRLPINFKEPLQGRCLLTCAIVNSMLVGLESRKQLQSCSNK